MSWDHILFRNLLKHLRILEYLPPRLVSISLTCSGIEQRHQSNANSEEPSQRNTQPRHAALYFWRVLSWRFKVWVMTMRCKKKPKTLVHYSVLSAKLDLRNGIRPSAYCLLLIILFLLFNWQTTTQALYSSTLSKNHLLAASLYYLISLRTRVDPHLTSDTLQLQH